MSSTAHTRSDLAGRRRAPGRMARPRRRAPRRRGATAPRIAASPPRRARSRAGDSRGLRWRDRASRISLPHSVPSSPRPVPSRTPRRSRDRRARARRDRPRCARDGAARRRAATRLCERPPRRAIVRMKVVRDRSRRHVGEQSSRRAGSIAFSERTPPRLDDRGRRCAATASRARRATRRPWRVPARRRRRARGGDVERRSSIADGTTPRARRTESAATRQRDAHDGIVGAAVHLAVVDEQNRSAICARRANASSSVRAIGSSARLPLVITCSGGPPWSTSAWSGVGGRYTPTSVSPGATLGASDRRGAAPARARSAGGARPARDDRHAQHRRGSQRGPARRASAPSPRTACWGRRLSRRSQVRPRRVRRSSDVAST